MPTSRKRWGGHQRDERMLRGIDAQTCQRLSYLATKYSDIEPDDLMQECLVAAWLSGENDNQFGKMTSRASNFARTERTHKRREINNAFE